MRFWHNQSGQSIIEISLITPLLLVALYIPADFGIAMFTANLTQIAVREAARIGSAKPPAFDSSTATAVKNEAISRLPARLRSPTVTVEYLWDGSGSTCMQVVRVSATGTYDYFFYQLIRLLGFPLGTNTQTITRAARMRYDYQPSDNNMPACTTVAASA